jgi:uncharacterized membrane protein YfcA
VSLAFCTVGSTLGSRPELTGQAPTVVRFGAITGAGGAVGAGLLLVTPSESFELIAPFLIAAASAVVLLQPRLAPLGVERPRGASPSALVGVFAVAVYGGYFGAAAGVLMLALLGVILPEPLLRINALKSVLLGLANSVAALSFAFFGPVDWQAVPPLAIGLLSGSAAGPWLARRVPTPLLRLGVAGAGLFLAARLLVA